MSPPSHLPLVAIVGRPNVGKSTLFNRYAGRRRALVADQPGITRDRIVEEIEVGARRVLIVDTAGLDPDAGPGIGEAVQAQARAAVAEADVILFVVDGRAGLLPEDEVLGRILRRAAKPLSVVVNKLDMPIHAGLAAEFERLGLPRVRAVSAEHGGGAWDALEELVGELGPAAEDAAEAPEEGGDAIRIAIVGRPNVGKSSLVNRLLGAERVVVADEPGTTRDSIDTRLDTPEGRFVLVDTGGIRRPARRRDQAERGSALMAVRALERADVAFVVIDASEGFTDQDARVAGMARDRGRAAALLANKWDLVGADDRRDGRDVREAIARGLRFMADTPVLPVSARSGLHLGRVLPLAGELLATASRRIPTPELNRWLKETVGRHEPAMAQRGARRRPLKFFYATQTDVRPPTFVLFCSGPNAVQPSYRRFLENRLREAFRLEGTPLRLRLRSRRPGAETR